VDLDTSYLTLDEQVEMVCILADEALSKAIRK